MEEDRRVRPLALRLARVTPHLAACLLAATGLALMVLRLPGPVVDQLIEAEFRAGAQVWQMRILGELAAGSRTFTTGALAAEDRDLLSAITRVSDFHRLNLLDAEGRVFWSSRADLVGHVPSGPASDAVAYGTAVLPADAIDDFALRALPGDRRAARHVATIREPVTLDGRSVGAIEFSRDVTASREGTMARVRAMLGTVAAFALVLLAGLSLALWRAARAQLRAAQGRAVAQARHLAETERLAREVRLLGELNGWLQSSRSLPELFEMVARVMGHILPGASGSLYVYSHSRDVLEGAASWNGGAHDAQIRPEDCWGLRRGRTYAFGESEVDFACAHVHFDAPRRYVCIPILAHGETVGLMTLTRKAATPEAAFDALRAIAQTCAEQVSLAIANVRMRDELHHQAIRDPLTGLFNRRHMLEELRRLCDQRGAGGVALVSIDVDHFKRFNDNHGHDAGDVVLRTVAELVQRHAGEEGIACRVGGEELLVLWPGLDVAAAAERADRLRGQVAALAVRYGGAVLPRVTVSVGVAHQPTHGITPGEAVRAADEALYAAKAGGRNRVVRAGAPPLADADAVEAAILAAQAEGPSAPGGASPRIAAT